jgi:hypothetical protein
MSKISHCPKCQRKLHNPRKNLVVCIDCNAVYHLKDNKLKELGQAKITKDDMKWARNSIKE